MKSNVENALYHCGRDRVLHREYGGRPAVAIRWDEPRVQSPDNTKFLVREADTLDEAGALAAAHYANRLRDAAKELQNQAERIELALSRSTDG